MSDRGHYRDRDYNERDRRERDRRPKDRDRDRDRRSRDRDRERDDRGDRDRYRRDKKREREETSPEIKRSSEKRGRMVESAGYTNIRDPRAHTLSVKESDASAKIEIEKKMERLARVQAWKQQQLQVSVAQAPQPTKQKTVSSGLFATAEETKQKLSLLDPNDESDYAKFKEEEYSDEGDLEAEVTQPGVHIDIKTEAVKMETEGNGETTEEEKPMEIDVDPLEAYMATIHTIAREDSRKAVQKATKEQNKTLKWEEEEEEKEIVPKKQQRKLLEAVDHKTVDYLPFRKDFYIEVPEIAKMTPEEVSALRKSLDSIKIRGKTCPAPIKTFRQCGLKEKILSVLDKYGYDKPTPIQAQAVPAIMSGRDVIGIAKTGSGKTLAFLLPMYRQILDQPPLQPADGPIALIMVPTRELAVQIHAECKKFKKATGIRSICVYGGAGVKTQIGDLKRGAEIVVCTPGRMIDVLCTNKGRITNLKRVTYLCLDEADRMFDMGFEPQISRILQNIRPDRQTVLFSATFPRAVEATVRRILRNPVEISVRGVSVVSDTIEQNVEILHEEDKPRKLLSLVADWYDKGSILVFVDRQESCDAIWSQVMASGYKCGSLHGGKDQMDRDSTLKEFREGSIKIMIATSVAARGLDVPSLRLVVNYDVPSHLEDYVHRVGRTGRAGNKGTAFTFITPEEEEYSRDIVKALRTSGATVPEPLQRLYDEYEKKRSAGSAKKRKSGYGGHGYKFNEAEDAEKKKQEKLAKLAAGIEIEEEEPEEGGDEDEEALAAAEQKEVTIMGEDGVATTVFLGKGVKISQQQTASNAEERVKLYAQEMASMPNSGMRFTDEYEINDYTQEARWKVTNKEALAEMTELTGCGITVKGQYYPPGRNPSLGAERKLFLLIEGTSAEEVKRCKNEILRRLQDASATGKPDSSVQYDNADMDGRCFVSF